MKIKINAIIISAFIALATISAFAGPEALPIPLPTVPPLPVPIPSPSAGLFKTNEFDVSAFGIAAWPMQSHQTDQYLQSANALGGAVSAKYFAFNLSSVQLGAGLDTSIIRARAPSTGKNTAHRAVGLSDLNIIARMPFGSFAPFVSIGGGAAYGGGYSTQLKFTTPVKKFNAINDTKFDWTVSAGVEYRLNTNWGIVAAADFNDLGPKKNFVTPKVGLNFAF